MPISSRWTVPLKVCSLPTFLFGPPGSKVLDKTIFYDAERPETHSLTIASFRSWSQRFAAGLQKAGLQPGDRVLLFSGSNLFFPVAFMGVLMAGGIFTGANPGFVVRELAYQLKDSDSKFLICADESLELGIEAAESIGMSKDQVFLFDDQLFEGTGKSRLGVENWKTLVEPKEAGEKFGWYEPNNPKEATCCLNYSSGTTGVPKGVETTHYNYVANATQFSYLATLHPEERERTAKSKWLCFLPMYHVLAQTLFVMIAPYRQIPVYIMKKFDFIQVLDAVQKYKITLLSMVPPVVVLLAKHPATKTYDLSSVIEIGSGAAPLSGEVIEEAEALWPERDRKMKAWLGPYPGIRCRLGRGTACHAKIMNMEGTAEVPQGQRGEIWVKAPNVMRGYWRNPKATREIFVDGPEGRWMKTGDIAYIDSRGYFFIVDRVKELIKVKGHQVAPAELEAVLLEHPQVADACVVGVTIGTREVPRAYVVPKQGQNPNEDEVAEWMAERVSRYKRLVGGVVFVEAIPKNPSGKIMRKILRDRAKEEVRVRSDKEPANAKL